MQLVTKTISKRLCICKILNFCTWFKYGLKAQAPEAARPERAEAPSPGHRPGYSSSQLGAL